MPACCILVLQPGTEPVPPALGARRLNHWTAREVPSSRFLICTTEIMGRPSQGCVNCHRGGGTCAEGMVVKLPVGRGRELLRGWVWLTLQVLMVTAGSVHPVLVSQHPRSPFPVQQARGEEGAPSSSLTSHISICIWAAVTT